MIKPIAREKDFQQERFEEPFGEQVRSKEDARNDTAKQKTHAVFKDVKKPKPGK